VELQTAMTMSPKVVDKVRNLTAHYIYSASAWSTNRSRKRILTGLVLDGAIPARRILRSSYG
jgi:hypothetical protein